MVDDGRRGRPAALAPGGFGCQGGIVRIGPSAGVGLPARWIAYPVCPAIGAVCHSTHDRTLTLRALLRRAADGTAYVELRYFRDHYP